MAIPSINAAGIQYVRDHLSHFPRPDRAAAAAVRAWAKSQRVNLDPDHVDVVTLHYQPGAGFSWQGVVVQKMTLTEALLANWQGETDNNLVGSLFGEPWAGHLPGRIDIVPQLHPPAIGTQGAGYQVFNGLFWHQAVPEYSPQNRVNIDAQALQRFIWQLDFHSVYKSMLDDYWEHHLDGYRQSARLNFLAACNKQAGEGSLSRAATRLAWQAAGLVPASSRIKVRPLNVYGYLSTDLLYIKASGNPLTVLYVPGNSSPLHEFSDEGQLQDWFARQCQDAGKRQVLMAHFAQADAPDGLSYSGLATALDGLAVYPKSNHLAIDHPGFTTEGHWPPRDYVNYKASHYNPVLQGDLFQALAERHRRRSYQDANFAITSDAEVSKARWRGYLDSALNYLAPLALVLPELAPLFALGGVAQFGLGLDRAINAKTQQLQAEGVESSVFGVLNALPLAHAATQERPLRWLFKEDRFVMPSRVNDQLGYPLGPVSPPHLPGAEQAMPYFHYSEPIAALADADPAVAGAIARIPRYDGNPDALIGSIDGYGAELIYDLEADAFILQDDLNQVAPTQYIAQTDSKDLLALDQPNRQVTDAMRMNTLRALGIDLQLPFSYPQITADTLQPIAKQFSSLWIGTRLIDPDLLSNLGKNARQLATTTYRYRLFLSAADASAHAANVLALAEHAPQLQVLTLEQQAFFDSFKQSPYHAQYQAALGASHHASAADILRYWMLDHEGGLYMDIDDSLLAPGEYPLTEAGHDIGDQGEPLEDVPLLATPEGLVLFPPVCNEKMTMNWLYNTSIIGSHPGNPTLRAILEQMQVRYAAEPGFYDSRPLLADDPQAFYEYANKLSRLTGPALVNDIIDQRLPLLKALREVTNFHAMPRMNAHAYIDPQQYQQHLLEWAPLSRIVRIGNNNSWAKP